MIRIREGGEITHQFQTEKLPLACMLGGPERKSLFLCRADHPDEAQKTGSGGCIDIFEVDVAGTGLP